MTMQAGMEMDTLIHQKVMGESTEPWPFPSRYKVTGEAIRADGRRENLAEREFTTSTTERFIPPYSSNIASAWLVVEKLVREGHSFDLSADENGIDAIFDAKFLVNVSGFSAAHAICLAALRAVGADVSNGA